MCCAEDEHDDVALIFFLILYPECGINWKFYFSPGRFRGQEDPPASQPPGHAVEDGTRRKTEDGRRKTEDGDGQVVVNDLARSIFWTINSET